MTGQNEQLHGPRRSRYLHSWLALIGLFAVACVGTTLLTIYAEFPGVASCLIIAVVGYALRFEGANLFGIVSWLAAAAMLSLSLATPTRLTVSPPDLLLALGGLLLSLPAGIVFLIASIRNRKRCRANCAGYLLAVFTVLIFCLPGMTLKIYRSGRNGREDMRQTIVALHCVARDANAHFARFGQVPNDKAELAAFRGKPISEGILYSNQGDDSYVLFSCVPEVWGYHDPWGTGLNYFGMNEAQRIRIDSGF